MLRVITGCDEQVAAWLRSQGHPFSPPYTALAVVDDDAIVGGVVFNGYTGPNIEMSTISAHTLRLTRPVLRAIFDYPFNQAGCVRVTAHVRASNMKARKMARRLGFEPEGKSLKYYGDDDAMIYGLLRKNCRWING